MAIVVGSLLASPAIAMDEKTQAPPSGGCCSSSGGDMSSSGGGDTGSSGGHPGGSSGGDTGSSGGDTGSSGGSPVAVPEPASMLLLGGGVVGLAAVRRLRRKRK